MEIRDPSSCERRVGASRRSRSLTAGWMGALLLCGAQAWAQPSTAVHQFRVVGGLASVNQYRLHEEPFWSHRLSTLTQGRIQAEIVPFDRAGIRGTEPG